LVYEDYLFTKVISAILSKWPRTNRTIRIQHDNAPEHIGADRFKELWEEKKAQLHLDNSPDFEFRIELYCQPPNSPDLNVLDLGVFAALKSLQWKEEAKNVSLMVERVTRIFDEWPAQKLNNVFLTLQTCMNQVIECLGDNDYKLVHMNKARLERLGLLPRSIRVTEDAERFESGGEDLESESDDDNMYDTF
jgi:hypothetical protein